MTTKTSTLLKSLMDVVTSIVLIAAAITLIYRGLNEPAGATNSLQVPSEPLKLDGAHRRGSKDAQAVMIVYADFQCPFCARFTHEVFPEVERRYVNPGHLSVAFRHLPLPSHTHALQAAAVAECAGRQGKFWDMHDRLFAEKNLNDQTLSAIQQSVGVDQTLLTRCLGDQTIGEVLQASITEANALGIRGTPAFFFGRRLADGRVNVLYALSGARPLEDFVRTVETTINGGANSWRSWFKSVTS